MTISGTDDYETGCSDYETERDHRASSSVLTDRWADSSHSETEHENSDNNNSLVKHMG